MNVSIETGGCTRADMDTALRLVSEALPTNVMCPTGSVYTNGYGNDCDVLVYGDKADLFKLRRLGYSACAATEYDDTSSPDWTAVRLGNVNVLLCYCPELYTRWRSAGEVCAWLGNTTKWQRIVLHEMIKNCVDKETAIVRATTAISESTAYRPT